MGKYEEIYSYLPFFETAKEKDICTWDGHTKKERCSENHVAYTVAYPVYKAKFLSFIEDVKQSDLIDTNYSLSLSKLGELDTDYIVNNIRKARLNDIRVIFTHLVRGERFCDGLWVKAFNKNLFPLLLKRLHELDIN